MGVVQLPNDFNEPAVLWSTGTDRSCRDWSQVLLPLSGRVTDGTQHSSFSQSARGRVGLGGCPPRPPTDPYVRTLAHTAPQIVGSLPNSAIRLCFGDTLSEARCLRRISQGRFHDSTPRFPPPGRLGQSSPISSVLSRRSDFLPFFPRHFVAFARRYHASTRLLSFLPMPSRAEHRAWSFGYRFPRAICSDTETTGSLKLPGDLDCLCAHAPRLRQVTTSRSFSLTFTR